MSKNISYEELGQEIGRLVTEKQAAYGDSFGRSGEVMRILYPEGISPEQTDDALTVIRIVDKLFRVATNKDALGESPYMDIAGYGLLAEMKRRNGSTVQTNNLGQVITCTPARAHGCEQMSGNFIEICCQRCNAVNAPEVLKERIAKRLAEEAKKEED